MLRMFDAELKRLDRAAAKLTPVELIEKLRFMPFADFAELLSLPHGYSNIAAKLPKPEVDEVQLRWTGDTGPRLLRASIDFVRSVHYNYVMHTGEQFSNVLDFGVGWGRLARLFYYYVGPEQFYGLDPAEPSHERLRTNNVLGNFATSDYMFHSNPFKEKFDLIFAFSVFTHIGPDFAKAALDTLADSLSDKGIIAVTIRPTEYWDMREHDGSLDKKLVAQLRKDHDTKGIAYLPHDGGMHSSGYGDVSYTVDEFEKLSDKLEVVGIDRSLSDSVQLYVFLRRKG